MKIDKLSVHERTTPGATDAGWVDVPITTQRVDLLTLQNGVFAILGQTPLASGKYTQMGLLLADSAMPRRVSCCPIRSSRQVAPRPHSRRRAADRPG